MKRFREFGSFLVVGAVATAVQYAVLVLLVRGFSVNPVVASTLGYCLSALLNYDLNHRVTFRSAVPYLRGLRRFAAISTLGLLLNAALMAVLVESAKLHYIVAQVAATVTVLLWNFFANRRWTY